MRSDRRIRWMLTTLVLAVALAACGADGAAGDAAADAPATAEVDARNIRFEPADLEVAVGTQVTFTNHDIVRHTVTSGDPGDPDGGFDERIDDEGDAVTITFDEPGTFAYYCELHRAMVGTVTVTG